MKRFFKLVRTTRCLIILCTLEPGNKRVELSTVPVKMIFGSIGLATDYTGINGLKSF